MGLTFPKIDVDRFRMSVLLRLTRQQVQEELSKVKPEKITEFVEQGKSLKELIFEKPGVEQQVRARVARYRWLIPHITDEQLLSLLPEWIPDMAKEKGPEGEAWMEQQIIFIRRFLIGRE